MYHEEGPDCVVEEDDGGGHEHGEADEFIELEGGGFWLAGLFSGLAMSRQGEGAPCLRAL